MSIIDLFKKTSKLNKLIEETKKTSEIKIKQKLKELKKQMFRYFLEISLIIFSIILITLGLIFLVNRFLPMDLTLLIFGLLTLIIYLFVKVIE